MLTDVNGCEPQKALTNQQDEETIWGVPEMGYPNSWLVYRG